MAQGTVCASLDKISQRMEKFKYVQFYTDLAMTLLSKQLPTF